METENRKIETNSENILTQEQFEQMMFEKFERVKALFLANNKVLRLDTDE